MAHIHVEKQRRIRQDRRHAIEAAKRLAGLLKQALHGAQLHRRVRRQGRRHERADLLPADARQFEPPQAARGRWFRHC
jgi:hypothetical protein